VSDYDILGVDHVNITTPAEFTEDVVKWYRECIGLQEISKPAGTREGGAWFKAGHQEIHISVDEHNPPKTAHFGLVVTEYKSIIEKLRAARCHIEQASAIPGRHRFYTRDPAGNRLEIVHFDEEQTRVVYEEAP
jgi:catechol 2,3-dioxygenase-like lactoylglutathione lyase family enzyme